MSIKGILTGQKGDFDNTLFSELLTRSDGLAHVLYSDIQIIMQKLKDDFPDLITIRSIGKTWQDRDIQVITLDARKLMESKGVKPASFKPINSQELAELKKKREDADELSDMELLEKNEDIRREENKKKKEKDDMYNALSDDAKNSVAAAELGLDDSLVQIHFKTEQEGIFSSSAEN